MFSRAGLALMLLDHATVEGRHLPPGSVGTEEDFGNDLPKLICQGLIFPFDPAKGLPPVPVDGKAPSYAYADFNAYARSADFIPHSDRGLQPVPATEIVT